MKHILFSVILFIFSEISLGQINYLEKGNRFISEENYAAAERIFIEAIKSDSSNLIYQCQLALALMDQGKHKEAQIAIDNVLLKDSANVGALWYAGMNNYLDKSADLRHAVKYFEKTIPLLDKSQGQYYSANWFIARCYEIILKSNGLSYDEVSRMLECYSIYLKLQPDADDAGQIQAFVKHIRKDRPPSNVLRWVDK